MEEKIKSNLEKRKQTVQLLENKLSKLPSGKIYCQPTKFGNRYRIYSKGKIISVNIKESKKLISQLIEKEMLICRLHDEKILMQLDEMLIEHLKKHPLKYDKYLNAHPTILYDIKSNDADKKSGLLYNHINAEPGYREFLTVHTADGTAVRSKSEVIIHDGLKKHKYLFLYERPIEINGHIYFPDFTIIHPKTGELIIWEHLGRMDDPDYVNKSIEKIHNYIQAGFIPGVNLIISYESANKIFDSQETEKIIELYLG